LNNKKWCVFEGEKDIYGINNFDPALFVGKVTSINDENDFSNYYEGIIKGENKSNGIKMILKETGISLENSIAIGDSINDISALKTVNLGIAMGNACSELKEIAQYITDDCKHGGVGKAMKTVVLT